MQNRRTRKGRKIAETPVGSAFLLFLIFITFAIEGCQTKRQEVTFVRLEQTLFDNTPSSLRTVLLKDYALYDTPLLNINPQDATTMGMLREFVQDGYNRHVYQATDSLYHDLGWLERELGEALYRIKEQCPDIQYERFYTLITTDFYDYPNRVFCNDNELALSIDHYAVGKLGAVVPEYIARVSQKEYIAADCIAAIARQHEAMPTSEPTLLDYAIAEGKALYLVETALPSIPDTILLHYSKEQLSWMEANTAKVWGWLIENKLLYSHDYNKFHNIIDEAPKTNAFGEGSAPRTTAYIGWQIVRRYMKKNKVSLREMLKETDSHKILSASGWRP